MCSPVTVDVAVAVGVVVVVVNRGPGWTGDGLNPDVPCWLLRNSLPAVGASAGEVEVDVQGDVEAKLEEP